MAVLMLAGISAAAETEIHRCLLDDGTFAFQQSPCDAAGSKAAGEDSGDVALAAEDDQFDVVNPFDEATSTPPKPALPASQDRTECEKTTRDAIDAIDLEMRETAYTKEQGQEYREELLALTRQLRACKQL